MKKLLTFFDPSLRLWTDQFENDSEWNVLYMLPADFLEFEAEEINGIIAIAPEVGKMDFVHEVEKLANLLMPDPEKDVPFFWLVVSSREGKSPVLYGSFTRKFNKKILSDLPANFYEANHDWKGWKDQFRTYV